MNEIAVQAGPWYRANENLIWEMRCIASYYETLDLKINEKFFCIKLLKIR